MSDPAPEDRATLDLMRASVRASEARLHEAEERQRVAEERMRTMATPVPTAREQAEAELRALRERADMLRERIGRAKRLLDTADEDSDFTTLAAAKVKIEVLTRVIEDLRGPIMKASDRVRSLKDRATG